MVPAAAPVDPSAPVAPDMPSGPGGYRRLRSLGKDPLAGFSALFAESGDLFAARLGKRRFALLFHPDLVRQLVLPDSASDVTKGRAVRRSARLLGNGLLTSEGDEHLRNRKLAQPAFQPRHLAPYAAPMVAHTRAMVDGWSAGDRVETPHAAAALTLRIAAETMFGTSLDPATEMAVKRALDETLGQFNRGLAPWAPLLERFPLPHVRRFERSRDTLHRVVEGLIAERRALPAELAAAHGDLLSLLLRASDAHGPLTDEQLRDEAMTLLLAGHETTANALVWLWYLLDRNPDVRDRVEAEVDTVLEGRDPAAEDVTALPYLSATIQEALRLYPPGPALARRVTKETVLTWPTSELDPSPAERADVLLEAGTEVIMPTWQIHRDPRWWPEPESFLPERFMDEAAAAERPRFAWLPFGAGRRVCIGQGFAMMEAVLVAAVVAQRWRLELAPDARVKPVASFTVRPANGMPMIVRERPRTSAKRSR